MFPLKLLLTFFLHFNLVNSFVFAQAQETKSWQVKISVAPELQKSFNKGGRLLIRFSGQNKKEPRQNADFRPAIVLDDVKGIEMMDVDIPTAKEMPVIYINNSSGIAMKNLKIPVSQEIGVSKHP